MTVKSINFKQYIEQREDSYFIKDSRVSLDSVVIAFLNGVSPESIVQSFPVLNLEQVYGANTFYLANKAAVDLFLEEGKENYEKSRLSDQQENKIIPLQSHEITFGKSSGINSRQDC